MQQEIWFQKYRILGLLGRGGTAEVYLAEHIRLNSYRAIKRISKNHPLYEQQRNEAFILKNLKHSCIPIIYDIEENEEGSYIVEQYLEGMTLKEYVKLKGAFREDMIIHVGIQLCDLILYLHSINRPVLYVDLKPENILLSGRTVKLIDFGSALYRDELPEHPRYAATKGYAAPELYGQDKIDERCDVYGIGIILYYMATGKALPQNGDSARNIDLACNCSKRLKNIINHCLRYHPSQRYSSVTRLCRELSAAGKNQFQSAPDNIIRIAVAGTQPRIGVTHFAFRLSGYYISRNLRCLYHERNSSGCIQSIKSRYEGIISDRGVFQIEQIPVLADQTVKCEIVDSYQVIVQDFGCLTKRNLEDFLKADVKLLLLGAKDWELNQSEAVLSMLTEYEDVIYLFNFLSGRQFQQVIKNMKRLRCFRIPYEPEPFGAINRKNGQEMFAELYAVIRERVEKAAADNLRLEKRFKENKSLTGGDYEEQTNAYS